MSVRRLASAQDQPRDFCFSESNLVWATEQLKKYPAARQASAVVPLLWRAQEQHGGWLPEPAIRFVADFLDMPYIRVLEVATFYTMFQLCPVGKKAHIQVCGNISCLLRGAEGILDRCRQRIACTAGTLSEEGDFSWEEVECLGACANAPMVQIGKDVYEDLTPESFEGLLDALVRGEDLKPGSQSGRCSSEPEGGCRTLRKESSVSGKQCADGGESAI